jgi:hypothetical protein
MRKYTQEEREKAIKEIEGASIKPEEWEGPHETKITSFKYVDDVPNREKNIMAKRINMKGGRN